MTTEGEKGEGKGFKVEDRRRFSPETGEPRETQEEAKPSQPTSEQPVRQEPPEDRREKKQDYPEINFSTFVISLSTQALMHLGEIPNPLSGKAESDIALAKQMIDIIGLLRDKTQGNLDQGEGQLLEDVLYDLRLKYVEAVKKK